MWETSKLFGEQQPSIIHSCLTAIDCPALTLAPASPFPPAQGALDGGLDIPHNEKRFVGYDKSSKKMDAETLAKYIHGGHVEEYMETMQVSREQGGAGQGWVRGFEEARVEACKDACWRHGRGVEMLRPVQLLGYCWAHDGVCWT